MVCKVTHCTGGVSASVPTCTDSHNVICTTIIIVLQTKSCKIIALLKFSLYLLLKKSYQNRLLLKHNYVYCLLLINYVRGHIDDLPTLS